MSLWQSNTAWYGSVYESLNLGLLFHRPPPPAPPVEEVEEVEEESSSHHFLKVRLSGGAFVLARTKEHFRYVCIKGVPMHACMKKLKTWAFQYMLLQCVFSQLKVHAFRHSCSSFDISGIFV